MSNPTGLPLASQILLYDALATILKGKYAAAGLNAPGESGTLAVDAQALYNAIVGDGSTTYGLGNLTRQKAQLSALQQIMAAERWDKFAQRNYKPLVLDFNPWVSGNTPATWNYRPSNGYPGGGSLSATPFDFWLTRLNALHPNTPATPTAGTLTAATNPSGIQGGLPNVGSGTNAPYVYHTLCYQSGGTLYDYIESQPTSAATRLSLVGSQDAYTYTIAGAVPAGVGKVRMWRSYVGGSAGAANAGFDQDVVVTPGAGSYPVINITNPDTSLRMDFAPPVFAQCLLTPELACIIALAYALVTTGNPQMVASGMISPWNVFLNPGTAFAGWGNLANSNLFGAYLVGTGYTANTYPTANAASANVQGFQGGIGADGTTAHGIQFRVTSTLNAAGTVTFSYHYWNAANPPSGAAVNVTAQTSGTFSGTAVGSLATFAIPAGYIVKDVTITSVSGMASGTIVAEAIPARSY